MPLTKEPMRSLVAQVAAACEAWLEIDDLPSPPADAHLLRQSDDMLAEAVEVLCRAYPRQMGCDRHPAGRAALSSEAQSVSPAEGRAGNLPPDEPISPLKHPETAVNGDKEGGA